MRPMLLIVIFAVLLAGVVLAEDRNPPRPPAVEQPVQPVAEKNAPTPTLQGEGSAITLPDPLEAGEASLRPAMMAELSAMRAEERQTVTELVTALGEATTLDERIDLQHQIVAAKNAATLESLTIQLAYAERGGYEAQAQSLQAEIEQFEQRLEAPRTAIRTDSTRERPVRGGDSR